ncbi:MAG TPA: ABC transporter substrate-binding protein [Xanthobacteraceae bacterium]|jgi:polar amino acid transport system substrate-binding protein|nr:ABC transporter substrate-binding protein [Xanthobacteraceae bacterium]
MTKWLARRAFLISALLSTIITSAMANNAPPDVVKELAPHGKLRAAINFGNTVLAQKDPATGEPRGVSAELARELAKRLGVPVEFVTFDAAGKVFEALKQGAWDIAFLAIDPLRAEGIDFTPPYVIIEGTYLVPANSALRTIADVDREGVRVAVGRGSAYDLFLTRALKQAKLVREPSGNEALAMFMRDKLEAAAGVKQPIVAFAKEHPDTRVIEGRFMVIDQAMGTPKGRPAGLRYLKQYIEEMKASGFVANALKASGQLDASVAPPAPVQ